MFLFLLSLIFVSCEEDRIIYDGPTVVEFAPATASIKKGTTATPGTYSAKIQLVGPQRDTDLVLDYAVDPASTAATDQYTIEGTSGKVTIPAKSSFGYVKVNAVPDNIPSGTRTIVLLLQGNAEVRASENYKKFTLTITQ